MEPIDQGFLEPTAGAKEPVSTAARRPPSCAAGTASSACAFRRSRLVVFTVGLAVAGALAFAACGDNPCPPLAKPLPPEGAAAISVPSPGSGARGLIVYDTSGPWGVLGELYAVQVANLMGRFGTFTAKPSAEYRAGDIAAHDALVYVGASYDEPLGDAFLDDVLASTKPVLWLYQNVWKLAARQPTFADQRGWRFVAFDTAPPARMVHYKGQDLPRDTSEDNGPLALVELTRPELARVVADASRPDGTRLPWAVRSGAFTYVAELPLRYVRSHDRYVVFADLLFELLAPNTPERHRAMVRIEDVGPHSDPQKLRQLADYLKGQGVPFGFSFYPRYVDPHEYYHRGAVVCLDRRDELVAAVQYLRDRGGTMVLFGLTHQLDERKNPFSGASGDDYEFFLASIDGSNRVVLEGPPPNDSEQWAMDRMGTALGELQAYGLPLPKLFEFPRYAASVPAYRAAGRYFAARYERGLYFAGLLRGGAPDYEHFVTQSFPYEVRDVYGMVVIPENLGGYAPESFFGEPPHTVADILAAARGNLVVRDGFASFYYAWYKGIPELNELVQGIRQLGYEFVSPAEVAGIE